jgi:hypothetical protein
VLFFSGFYKFRYAIKTSRDKRLLISMYYDLVDNDNRSDVNPATYGKLTKDEFEANLKAIKDSVILPRFDGHGDKVYLRKQEVSVWDQGADMTGSSSLRLCGW